MPDLPLVHEYLPQRTETGGASPVVFLLHGRGADERDLLPIARHLPDELATISFRGPDPLMGGYTWYELDLSDGGLHGSQPEPEGFRRSLGLVRDSIDAATEEYGVDPERIGLLGFSQGAIMALSLLLEAPVSFRWVAALHGYLADSHSGLHPDGLEGKPVFIGAGTADRMIPAERANAAAEALRDLGCEVRFETYAAGHGIDQRELEDLVDFARGHS